MKRNQLILCLILTLCISFLASCGTEEEKPSAQMSKYTVIDKEESVIPDPEEKSVSWYLLGSQFIEEDVVRIWGVNAGSLMDIYLYHGDGSGELLLSGVPGEYCNNWYLDEEGGAYIFGKNLLIRLDKEWNELYRHTGGVIRSLCKLEDGRMAALVEKDNRLSLTELEPSSGRLEEKADLGVSVCYISGGEDGLLLMDMDGIWKLELKDGSRESLMPFGGNYTPGGAVSAFRMKQDGTAQVIQKGGKLQTLQLRDIAEGREVILVRDTTISEDMKNYIEMFNRQSTEYYVATEELDMSEIYSPAIGFQEISRFQEETTMQIAARKGADIIGGSAVGSVRGLIENGAFEDLAPYMERDGIREEDYFPAAFSYWRRGNSIYSVCLSAGLVDMWINAELLEGNEEGEVGKLVEALLSYEGDAVFREYMTENSLLDYFLDGSESLWGMVDWEEGVCDFSGGLFAGILEVVKRYAYDYDDTRQDIPFMASRLWMEKTSYYGYDYYAAQEEAQGRVRIGFLCEGGNSADLIDTGLLAISSTSAHKEGAWEFIRFLLSEEVQAADLGNSGEWASYLYPMNKAAFDKCGARAVAQGSIVTDQNGITTYRGVSGGDPSGWLKDYGRSGYKETFDPTEERVARIKAALESIVLTDSSRISGIRSIIDEEAGAYFAGDKSIEEVIAIIQNRAQLYIDENR